MSEEHRKKYRFVRDLLRAEQQEEMNDMMEILNQACAAAK